MQDHLIGKRTYKDKISFSIASWYALKPTMKTVRRNKLSRGNWNCFPIIRVLKGSHYGRRFLSSRCPKRESETRLFQIRILGCPLELGAIDLNGTIGYFKILPILTCLWNFTCPHTAWYKTRQGGVRVEVSMDRPK